MTEPDFSLWLEFEAAEPWHSDPADDFFNMIIRLRDGREYGLNVWTFKYFERARAENRESGGALGGSYVVAPDLFVERLERTHIETVVAELLRREALSDDWLVARKDDELALP